MKKTGLLYSLVLALAAVLFQACSGASHYPAELQLADSLCTKLKVCDSLFKTVDTVEVKRKSKQLNYAIAYLQLNQKDTLGKEEGIQLTRFLALKRPFSYFLKEQSKVYQKLKEERKQCENLQHDLNARTCITEERNRCLVIFQASRLFFPGIHEILQTYSSLYPSIEARINTLRAKGGKEPEGLDKVNTDEDDD
jgi:hypothetical protein